MEGHELVPVSPYPVLVGGAHRGAREIVPIVTDLNRTTESLALAPTFVDPMPGRSVALASRACAEGIAARGIQGRIEEVLSDAVFSRAPVILHVDDAGTIASTLADTVLAMRRVCVYLFVRLPSAELLGIRGVLGEGDEKVRDEAVAFFGRLGDVTARASAGQIFGREGRPEHATIEPVYRRRWFGEHLRSNLRRAYAGTRPEFHPFEVTTDGTQTLPLLFHRASEGWTPVDELASGVVRQTTMPLIPGREMMIAEVGARGIRLHRAWIRVKDGSIRARSAAEVTPEGYAAAERERQVRAALERARLQTLSRTQPVYTSD